MKYIADVLTVLRLVSAFVIFFAILQESWVLAAALFAFGILTDAVDGVAARRWPYSDAENRRLWWRRDAHLFDNVADSSLAFAALLGLAIVMPVWWLVLCGVAMGSILFLVAIERSRHSRPQLAERIDVCFGWTYGALLASTLVYLTWQAAGAQTLSVWLGVYVVAGLGLLWMKRDRLVGRPELDYGKRWQPQR